MENKIIYKNVFKKYGHSGIYALNDISLEIDKGEFITIIGTSGSGKTTLIKTLNKLLTIDDGEISIFGQNINDMDSVILRRKIGYVIQEIGLFPHMTVEKNISVVPKLLKWNKEDIKKRVDFLLNMIGLNPDIYLKKYPKELSGGQRQRIGLARALAAEPEIMILDEPFGALDAITRKELQDELIKIHAGDTKTYLFVTHDIREAFKLGDRIIVMDKGKIVLIGTEEELKTNENSFVKNLLKAGAE
ncbi:MAG: ABC transporter ATP-binding protein [Clostridiales Family XIII bacterium]|jgi:osmoprotectant transport system ATP-binding protein|nr:ABC transporter ATP-binding protein [Clostridiales Family XIII bacterium]